MSILFVFLYWVILFYTNLAFARQHTITLFIGQNEEWFVGKIINLNLSFEALGVSMNISNGKLDNVYLHDFLNIFVSCFFKTVLPSCIMYLAILLIQMEISTLFSSWPDSNDLLWSYKARNNRLLTKFCFMFQQIISALLWTIICCYDDCQLV